MLSGLTKVNRGPKRPPRDQRPETGQDSEELSKGAKALLRLLFNDSLVCSSSSSKHDNDLTTENDLL